MIRSILCRAFEGAIADMRVDHCSTKR